MSPNSNRRKKCEEDAEENERRDQSAKGQIRQTGGLASEDLIGFTLAADLLSLEENKNCVSRKLEDGGISHLFQEPVIMWMGDIIIIITGGWRGL